MGCVCDKTAGRAQCRLCNCSNCCCCLQEPLLEAIGVMQHTDVLIGMHGAGVPALHALAQNIALSACGSSSSAPGALMASFVDVYPQHQLLFTSPQHISRHPLLHAHPRGSSRSRHSRPFAPAVTACCACCAGWVNALFLKQGAVAIQLFPYGFSVDQYTTIRGSYYRSAASAACATNMLR